jgi:hypothetical protein
MPAGVAYAILENVTFNCEPWRNGTSAGAQRGMHLKSTLHDAYLISCVARVLHVCRM